MQPFPSRNPVSRGFHTVWMAFAMTTSLPVMILFAIVQKWFIAGLTAGAVKG